MRFSSTCCSDGFEVRQLPCKLMHKETTVGTAICEDRACITTRFWQLMLQSCSIKKVGFDFLPMVPFFLLCCKISMYLHCVSTPRNWRLTHPSEKFVPPMQSSIMQNLCSSPPESVSYPAHHAFTITHATKVPKSTQNRWVRFMSSCCTKPTSS